ncbi:sulfite exporter TauE/SafE family protein [Kiritimatiellaeota bacterium B1221]|nr:sulfite exporter TauE/SafE family protein [Kiritimatiellaeota bacterium B1221]
MIPFATIFAGNSSTFFTGTSKTGIPGAGILGVVLLANLMEQTRQSVGVLLPLLIAADLFAVFYYRQHADWKLILRVLPWTLAGLGIGYATLKFTQDQEMNFSLLLGGLVLGILVLDFLRNRLGWNQMPHHPLYTAILGIATGFATTIGNVAGPVMSLYLLSLGLDKHKFMGSMAWFFLIINTLKIPLFVSAGMITVDSLKLSVWFLPGIVLGAVFGRFLFKRIPAKPFAVAVQILAAAAAIRLMVT